MGFVRGVIALVLVVAAILATLRFTVLRHWVVPEDPTLAASLAPTLSGGDVVLLWRGAKPAFGDLVLCPNPEEPGKVVVGRLLGEEGDKISWAGNDILINGRSTFLSRACEPPRLYVAAPSTGDEVELRCEVEMADRTVGENLWYLRAVLPGQQGGKGRQVVVEPGKAYLISDNRAYPYDSRDYGSVERAACSEAVVLRLWSAKGYSDESKRFTQIH